MWFLLKLEVIPSEMELVISGELKALPGKACAFYTVRWSMVYFRFLLHNHKDWLYRMEFMSWILVSFSLCWLRRGILVHI